MSSAPETPLGGAADPAARRWLKLLLLALLVGFAALYLRRHAADLTAEIDYDPRFLAPLLAAEVALLILRGLLSRSLCSLFGVRLGVAEATRLSAWSSFANYVTPFIGGTGLRAVYLRRYHQLPLSSFLSVQAATYTLHFMVSAGVGLLCLYLLPDALGATRAALAGVLALILAACALLHRWPFAAPGGSGRVAASLRRVLQGWERIRGADTGALLWILLANAIIQALAIGAAFGMLGMTASVVQLFFVASIYSLSILLAITPAALGVSEGAVAFAAQVAGLAAPTALVAAAARRVVTFAVTASSAAVAQLLADKNAARRR